MKPEITKNESESEQLKANSPSSKARLVWIVLAVMGIAAYFAGLSLPLVGPDEPRYSQIAREMFERGDWITPKLGGLDWFEKPALLYWLQIFFYKFFGISEFSARFGSALFGLGTIVALWMLGRKAESAASVQSGKWKVEILRDENPKFQTSNPKSQANSSFANWLALVAASSLGLIGFSHAASFDIILTFPLTAALAGFFIYELSGNERSSSFFSFPLLVFYFFIGVALIAKGLIAAVFPLAIVAFYYVLRWKIPTKSFLLSLFWGALVTLLVASIWYVPMYQTNGWKFIDEFFIQHHFQRYTSNKYQHPQPFYFFFWVLPLMTLPWLPLFFAAIWDLLKTLSSKFRVQNQETKLATDNSQLTTFAWAWLLVPLVFFSISGSKLPGYILPALPAALILAADYAWRLTLENRRWKILWQSAAFAVFAGTVVTASFFAANFVEDQTTKNLLATANARGFADAEILNLHTVSHNSEFYGAGRLARDANGKIRQFYGAAEIAEYLKNASGKTVLVIAPPEYMKQLTDSDLVNAELVARNNENALFAVNLK